MPGILGGANWGGAAADPETGWIYVKSSNFPALLAMDRAEADKTEGDYSIDRTRRSLTIENGVPRDPERESSALLATRQRTPSRFFCASFNAGTGLEARDGSGVGEQISERGPSAERNSEGVDREFTTERLDDG
jgi:hypothetical protein